MNPQPLTADQTAALHANREKLPVINENTKQVYVVVEMDVHRRAMDALREKEQWEAIQEGLAQVEAGEAISVDEAFQQIRSELASKSGE
jgi:predicted transcriptional regulator